MSDDRGNLQPVLGQCLFGYDRGHRLLGSSDVLPAASARILLIASDFEVAANQASPWGELTGVPLAEVGLYAISATWPAPEMPRPGCVWTHTLLVPFPILARLENLDVVLNCFRRPRGVEDLDRYLGRLPLPPIDGCVVTTPSAAVGAAVLEALYATPSRRVSVAVPTTDRLADGLLTTLWSQQWPGLRRTFRFVVRHSLEGSDPTQENDLRISRSPSGDRRAGWDTVDDDGVSIGFDPRPGKNARSNDPSSQGGAGWLRLAANDLTQRGPTLFRSFLKRYGADVTTGREAFAGLSSAFAALAMPDPGRSAPAFGRAILRWFHAPEEAGRLKREVLSRKLEFGGRHASRVHMHLTWLYLLHREVTEAVSCLDPDQWQEAVSQGLRASGRVDLWRLARRVWKDGDEEWAKLVLDALAPRSDASDAIVGVRGDWELFAALARRNRRLLEDARAWEVAELRSLLLALLEETTPDPATLLGVLPLVDDRALAASMFDRFERLAMARVVGGMVEGLPIARAWVDEAFRRPDELVGLVTSATRVARPLLVTLFARLGTDHRSVERVEPYTWMRLIDGATGDLAPDGWMRLWCFMLLFGLRRPTRGSERLLTSSYEGLSMAAKRDDLGDIWDILNDNLPGRWSYYSWDMYFRLRLATCDAFLSDRMDICSFTELTDDEVLISELILALESRVGGRRLLGRIMRKCAGSGNKTERFLSTVSLHDSEW